MKKNAARLLSALCVLALLVGLVPMGVAAAPAHTLWIVGDSTVCSFNDTYYYPRYGYGTQIGNYLDGTYEIKNLALSGRSSKSFLTEDNYTALKSGIKAGDALIIGFGHNDEKSEDATRYTDPKGDWQTEGSFAKTLYDNYVKVAQDAGAEAILCTPIVRRTSGASFSDSQLHVTAQGDYPAAIKKLAADKNAAVVDMTALTKAHYEKLGAAETLYLHAWTGKKETSVDDTHLNIYGAKVVARILAEALKQDGKTELGKHVVLGSAPTKEGDLKSNPDYVEPTYSDELPKSKLWKNHVATLADGSTLTFRGTVFGGMGGASKVNHDNQILETDGDGNMHVAALNGQGKIADTEDGFAMYYYRLPAGVPFTFSATAKVNSFTPGKDTLQSQCAFGLMARDDMYIDKGGDKSILSDYVVAGSLAGSNCFYRKGTKLGGQGTMEKETLAVGQSYDLSISYNGDGYTCTFGKEAPQSGGYDFQLTSVDPDYVYISLFASRNVDVTYSNIALEVEGGLPEDVPDPIALYLAGDSTVKDYSEKGMYNKGTAEELGSWGEFLGNYFNAKKLAVGNYANGGRSSRSFINEGKLKDIAGVLCEGDYLFIQFGHNDASDNDKNKAERYVPLGTPNANGVYPVTAPADPKAETLTWDCGGTYKWYLQQYIDVAKAAKATPVLVTPVARMYYNDDGTIRPHHDAESTPQDQMTNSYVTAMKQLGQEQDVLVIDMFAKTKGLFEDAYKVANDTYVITPDTYGTQLMGQKTDEATGAKTTDTTHNNKLGGMIEAAVMANAIKELKLDISGLVQAPVSVTGKTPGGKDVFTVDAKGKFTARDILSDYAAEAPYWSGVGQKLMSALPMPEPEPEKPPKPITGPLAGGGLETLFAELPGVKAADVTAVKYAGAMTGELTGDDLKFLVRDVNGKVRIDIPGVKAGKYTLTVTTTGKEYTAKDVEVQAHDRSGFAHQTVDANSVCTPYTEGVGAYNDDGTLKKDAVVLYVTDANKDTVTLTVGDKSLSGIGNILNTSGYKTNGANGGEAPKILLELSRANKPLVIRILGTVNAPKGVSPFKAGSSNGSMCYMKYAKNVTIEGIGPDATIKGWGVSFSGDASDGKGNWGTNFEVRNLSFKEVPEDCVEVTGNANGDGSIKEGVEHAWVHNCAFYRPTDIKNPAESDKVQGDGAVDFKSGQYMTLSYNYFDSNHKTSLVGADDKCQQYHVTWHHNYWKNVESRTPLARQADIHIYNNLYEGQKSYCMSLRANTFIFSEANTFLGCKNPMIDEKSGGVCKSFGDVFTDCSYKDSTNTTKNDTVDKHATIVTDKTQKVTSSNKFANFDTAAGSYVAKNAYKLDTVDDAKKNIQTWGGVMKAASAMTVVAMTATSVTEPSTQPSAQPSPSTQPPAGTVAVTDVSLIKSVEVRKGRSKTLTATITPENATDKRVNWTSSDTKVVTVDQTGEITGVSEGEAKVTVTTVDGGFTATCRVTVYVASSGGSISGGGGSVRPTAAPSAQPSGTPDIPVTIDPDKPASENFGDVVKGSWYEPGITYVVKQGLFQGIAQGVFAPQQDMTRAMLMTVLARLDGQDTSGGEAWYTKGLAWAVGKNISDGTMLDMSVTREQMVTMLYRYAKPGAAGGDLSKFADGEKVADWAKDAMTWAVANGILTGKDGGRLDPQGTATRAEVATILQRFVEARG